MADKTNDSGPEPTRRSPEEIARQMDFGSVEAMLLDAAGRAYWACRRALPKLDAGDFAQDVAVTILTKLDRYCPTKGRGRAWVGGIIRKKLWERMRRLAGGQARESTEPCVPFDGAPGPLESVVRGEWGERVRDALLELNDRERLVLKLRVEDDLRWSEIAERCGEPVGTLMARARRAYEKLRRSLNGGEGQE